MDYEDEADTIRYGKTCVVVEADINTRACAHRVSYYEADVCERGDGTTEGGHLPDDCGLSGDERSNRERYVAAPAFGGGAGFLRGGDLLDDH